VPDAVLLPAGFTTGAVTKKSRRRVGLRLESCVDHGFLSSLVRLSRHFDPDFLTVLYLEGPEGPSKHGSKGGIERSGERPLVTGGPVTLLRCPRGAEVIRVALADLDRRYLGSHRDRTQFVAQPESL
jgi:hypothetical protein